MAGALGNTVEVQVQSSGVSLGLSHSAPSKPWCPASQFFTIKNKVAVLTQFIVFPIHFP